MQLSDWHVPDWAVLIQRNHTFEFRGGGLVLSTQRVNRAVLPGMRRRGQGLVIWVSSSSVKGGTNHFAHAGRGRRPHPPRVPHPRRAGGLAGRPAFLDSQQ